MGACCRVACVGQVASYMVSDSEEVSLLGTACMGFRHCPMEGVLGSVHMEVMACAVVVVSLLQEVMACPLIWWWSHYSRRYSWWFVNRCRWLVLRRWLLKWRPMVNRSWWLVEFSKSWTGENHHAQEQQWTIQGRHFDGRWCKIRRIGTVFIVI